MYYIALVYFTASENARVRFGLRIEMEAAAGSQVSNMEIKATEEKRSSRVEPVFNEHFFHICV